MRSNVVVGLVIILGFCSGWFGSYLWPYYGPFGSAAVLLSFLLGLVYRRERAAHRLQCAEETCRNLAETARQQKRGMASLALSVAGSVATRVAERLVEELTRNNEEQRDTAHARAERMVAEELAAMKGFMMAETQELDWIPNGRDSVDQGRDA